MVLIKSLLIILLKCSTIICEIISLMQNHSVGININHFWKSTGLCPIGSRNEYNKYLNSMDERLNMVYIGSLPNNAIKQIRIHWLLDLITINSVSKNQYPIYNFTYLDKLLDWMQMQNLYPGFELMGNPSNFFNDLEDSKQQKYWSHMVFSIASRYIDRYGINYIRKWRFETWNEPDLKNYNLLNFTVNSYPKYVDACWKGLRDALSNFDLRGSLKLGGPAGLFKLPDKHPLCWSLLKRCYSSSAAAPSCPIQFISFHKKGNGTAGGVLTGGLELLDYIQREYPARLRDIPVSNDEADILVNWSKNETWRADVRYAAMVALVIVQHHRELVVKRHIKIEVLSNDNAFMNYHPFYFTQRTLLARFQMNLTTPRTVQFVKKPVYAVMSLLSLLGNREIRVKRDRNDDAPTPTSPLLTMLATNSTRNGGETALLLIHVNDTVEDDEAVECIQVDMQEFLRDERDRFVVYALDNLRTNPYRVWIKHGAPVFPDEDVRDAMRKVENPHRLIGPTNSSALLKLCLPLPSVYLLHACAWTANKPPGQVTKLQAHSIAHNEALLVWKDSKIGTKCLKTYEIEFARNDVLHEDAREGLMEEQTFERVNPVDVTLLSYQHRATDGISGKYRVRAVDYWGRAGPYSKIINVAFKK